jgi:hypothetical protein
MIPTNLRIIRHQINNGLPLTPEMTAFVNNLDKPELLELLLVYGNLVEKLIDIISNLY